ncbi:hypothetical protein CLV37_11225 [Kineococcus rhizosphaerae]|uniref:Galactosyltransferase C-terminal domain-containing protein n=1 Tax=Kineococcus rhizosphaerae TaxID=559628 RepID=A0A2T0QYY0_9ACTN|nr:hypothetical protein CLV37_11225 [Kineococcus rhizosphaerae]
MAVLTIVAGRHEHLVGQLVGLQHSDTVPDLHVVVAMGDPGVRPLVEARAGDRTRTVVVDVPVPPDGELPLSRARNVAAATALAAGAELLVFLDVDCVPSPGLLRTYRDAAASAPVRSVAGPSLLCGAVTYLPPGVRVERAADLAGLARAASPHPARPAPAEHEVLAADESQWWLFWSLSFAVSARDWERFGGFCEEYRGYGGEDTDVAATVRSLGGSLFWVGGAEAFHQHHPTTNPPVQHVEAVVRNAGVFHARWGWFPMTGWLDAFAAAGLARYDAATRTWSSTGASAEASDSTAR